MHIINNHISVVTEVGVERVGPVSDAVVLLQVHIYCNVIRSRCMFGKTRGKLHFMWLADSEARTTQRKKQAGTLGSLFKISQSTSFWGCSCLGNCRRNKWSIQVQHESGAEGLCEHTMRQSLLAATNGEAVEIEVPLFSFIKSLPLKPKRL